MNEGNAKKGPDTGVGGRVGVPPAVASRLSAGPPLTRLAGSGAPLPASRVSGSPGSRVWGACEIGAGVGLTPRNPVLSLFGYIHRHLFTVANSTYIPPARLAIGCRKVISILLGRQRSMKDSIYVELGRDEIQFYLPSQNLTTQECASYQPTHHAPSLFIVGHSQNHVNRLIDSLNIGLSQHPATHHLRTVWTAYALELALQRRVGHHGY